MFFRSSATSAFLFCVVLSACGGSSAPARVCAAGQSIACTGPGGCASGQVCKADGTGYEPCVCGGNQDAGSSDADAAAEVTPDAASEGTPDAAPEVTPDAASEGTPDATSDGNPGTDAPQDTAPPPGDFVVPYQGAPSPASVVVKLQSQIVVGPSYDVTTQIANATNPGGVDATAFVESVRAMDEGVPALGCPSHAAKDITGDGVKDIFTAVVAGTPLCFEVRAKANTSVAAKPTWQSLGVEVKAIGMPGSVVLDQKAVTFVIPPS
jgi:hypothetical protein